MQGKWYGKAAATLWPVAMIAVPAGPLMAQEPGAAAAPADPPGSGDIVVTAQKRSENLQRVPIAISVISGEQIAKQNLRSVVDLMAGVPNLQTQSPLGDGIPIFALRGISMSDYSFSQDGPIATYFDDVYRGNLVLMGIGVYDIERVEVLKGPQSTLYGKNTTGGAINFISVRPGFTTSGYISAGFGNYNHVQSDGAFQTALGDTIASRTAFTFDRADGWFKNTAPGKPDLDGVRQYAIRQSFLYAPSEDFSILLRGSTSFQNPINYGIASQPTGTGIGPLYAQIGIAPDQRAGMTLRSGNQPDVFRRRARTYDLSATVHARLGGRWALTSITAWDKGNLLVHEDADGTPLRVADTLYSGQSNQISQELRLTGGGSRLDLTAGLYANRERVSTLTDLKYYSDLDLNGDGRVDAADCVASGFQACDFANSLNQQKVSLAAYVDASHGLTGRLKLRGGLRYTHDRAELRNFRATISGIDGTPIMNTIPGSADFNATTSRTQTTNNVSGRIGLDFQLSPHVLFYGGYSRGYRGAAFNGQAFFSPSELTTVRPETVDSVEIGAKTELFNRRLRLNAAAFWYAYANQQVLDVDPNTGTTPLINLKRSRIRGIEADARFLLTPTLALSGSLGLLDTEILEGASQGIDIRGKHLVSAPPVTASAALDWHLPVGRNRLSLHAGLSYASRQHFDLLNTPALDQTAYALADASLSFEWTKAGLTATFWGRNLTDKAYITYVADASSLGFIYRHVGTPRMYGASIRKTF